MAHATPNNGTARRFHSTPRTTSSKAALYCPDLSFARPGTRRNPAPVLWSDAEVANRFPTYDAATSAYLSGYQVGAERATEYLEFVREEFHSRGYTLPSVVEAMPIQEIREHRCDDTQRGVVIGFLHTIMEFAAGQRTPAK